MKSYIKTFLILLVLASLFILNESLRKEDPVEFNIVPIKLSVDIKGEIRRSGVYEVDEDTRVYQVIELAGGLLSDADTSNINLAQKVYDEMVITIPSYVEIEDDNTEQPGGKEIKFPISINTGTLEELMQIPGLGQVKAQAIIQYRNENGYFSSIDEIVNVSGIGDATFESIKEYITP